MTVLLEYIDSVIYHLISKDLQHGSKILSVYSSIMLTGTYYAQNYASIIDGPYLQCL